MSGWNFMFCEYFQFLSCLREEHFSMALPCILTSSCHKAKALQSRQLLQHWYWWPWGFLRIWTLQEWENHCRLWSFTWRTRPLATSDQLIVFTSLKVRNQDALFQSRTISINLWQIGVSDPQHPAEELVVLFVQAPQENGNGSQHHQCHKKSQSYKPTVWCWKGRTEIAIKQI